MAVDCSKVSISKNALVFLKDLAKKDVLKGVTDSGRLASVLGVQAGANKKYNDFIFSGTDLICGLDLPMGNGVNAFADSGKTLKEFIYEQFSEGHLATVGADRKEVSADYHCTIWSRMLESFKATKDNVYVFSQKKLMPLNTYLNADFSK